MRRAVRAASFAAALSCSAAWAENPTLLEKYKEWSAYAAPGTPKVCFALSQPKQSTPKGAKRGPIFFYISRWPADGVQNEVSVKMGYPFGEGAKVTANIGGTKFELFTKDEGAFVEKTEAEANLVEAMKGEFRAEDYRDEYREALAAVIEAKVAGKPPEEVERAAEAPTKIADLMSVLEASVAAAREKRTGGGEAKSDEAPAKPARASRGSKAAAAESKPKTERKRKVA